MPGESRSIHDRPVRVHRERIGVVGLRERQHRVDHARHARALGADGLDGFRTHHGISLSPPLQHLRVAVDDGERRFEFVRRIGDESALARECPFQATKHVVEGRGQHAELIATTLPIQPLRKVVAADLLLLDEPFAALDEITRMALNDDLMRLWESRRTTVVFVTHSVFESVYLSTRIAVMTARPGRIAADLQVELPQPRERAMRTWPGYATICATVSEELARAIAEVSR